MSFDPSPRPPASRTHSGQPHGGTRPPLSAGNVWEEVIRLAAGPVSGDLALDFRRVKYIGGDGLGALLDLHRRVRAAGGRLTLLSVRPLVAADLALTGLDSLFDVRRAR